MVLSQHATKYRFFFSFRILDRNPPSDGTLCPEGRAASGLGCVTRGNRAVGVRARLDGDAQTGLRLFHGVTTRPGTARLEWSPRPPAEARPSTGLSEGDCGSR